MMSAAPPRPAIAATAALMVFFALPHVSPLRESLPSAGSTNTCLGRTSAADRLASSRWRGRFKNGVVPSPMRRVPVSVSTPGSPSARTDWAVAHSAAVPRRRRMVAMLVALRIVQGAPPSITSSGSACAGAGVVSAALVVPPIMNASRPRRPAGGSLLMAYRRRCRQTHRPGSGIRAGPAFRPGPARREHPVHPPHRELPAGLPRREVPVGQDHRVHPARRELRRVQPVQDPADLPGQALLGVPASPLPRASRPWDTCSSW